MWFSEICLTLSVVLSVFDSLICSSIISHIHIYSAISSRCLALLSLWSVLFCSLGISLFWKPILSDNKIATMPCLVRLSGLGAGLQTEGLWVRFPVGTHAWLQTRSLVGGVREATDLYLLHMDVSLPLSLPWKKKYICICVCIYIYIYIYKTTQLFCLLLYGIVEFFSPSTYVWLCF